MDARLKRGIYSVNAVRGEEHDALEVLEVPEKDGDERVPDNVSWASFGKKDVCFIQEQDGIPAGG